MKKLIIFAILICIYSTSKAAYSRMTKNGGPNGYYSTLDSRVGKDRIITCVNPGSNSCPKIMPQNEGENDPNLETVNHLFEIAIEAIENGNLNGNETHGLFKVEWNSDNSQMNNSDIKIELI